MEYTIFIPSYNRATAVTTVELFPEAVIVCCKSQEDNYREFNPTSKLLVCPDSVQGNIARVRNWILKNSPTDYIVMLDDDIKHIGGFKRAKHFKLNSEERDRLILSGFEMMEDINTVLWGLNQNTDRQNYDEYLPISFRSVVLGVFMGIKRVPGLYFDERLPLKEDYDFSIQVLKKYRKILRFNNYHYEALHLINEGGCTSYRSYDREISQLEIFRKKWGRDIVKYDVTRSLNPIVKVPIKGV